MMSQTAPSTTSLPSCRPIVAVLASVLGVASTIGAGGCSVVPVSYELLGGSGSSGNESDDDTPGRGSRRSGVSAGTGGTSGATNTGGSMSTTGSPDPTGSTAGASGGTATTGGATSGGTATTGGATSGPPVIETCVDVAPPFDPTWPDATCESWRFEANACDEGWFVNAGYCALTCRRCEPIGGLPPEPMPPDCSALPNVTGGQGFTTRYWDCCQTHCGQQTGHRCSADGVTITGNNSSACQGGGSYACYDEAPYAVSECLSYGHVAVPNPQCNQCYRIQFTGEANSNPNDRGSALIEGKQMIVKVTNTGSDVAQGQMDLMIPGGGVGIFDACSQQWGIDLGSRRGGFLPQCTTGTHAEKKECVRRQCMEIPAGDARDGCLWFVDWLEIADNPRFTSEPTACPF